MVFCVSCHLHQERPPDRFAKRAFSGSIVIILRLCVFAGRTPDAFATLAIKLIEILFGNLTKLQHDEKRLFIEGSAKKMFEPDCVLKEQVFRADQNLLQKRILFQVFFHFFLCLYVAVVLLELH